MPMTDFSEGVERQRSFWSDADAANLSESVVVYVDEVLQRLLASLDTVPGGTPDHVRTTIVDQVIALANQVPGLAQGAGYELTGDRTGF